MYLSVIGQYPGIKTNHTRSFIKTRSVPTFWKIYWISKNSFFKKPTSSIVELFRCVAVYPQYSNTLESQTSMFVVIGLHCFQVVFIYLYYPIIFAIGYVEALLKGAPEEKKFPTWRRYVPGELWTSNYRYLGNVHPFCSIYIETTVCLYRVLPPRARQLQRTITTSSFPLPVSTPTFPLFVRWINATRILLLFVSPATAEFHKWDWGQYLRVYYMKHITVVSTMFFAHRSVRIPCACSSH